mgnify:CR=1 FL=1
MFAVDTNILIYYAAADSKVIEFFDAHKYDLFYLPSIVVVEFLSYPLVTPYTIEKFKQFAYQMLLVNLDFPVAELAASLRRDQKLALADAVIAASALFTNSTLITRNERDFKKVQGLKLIIL